MISGDQGSVQDTLSKDLVEIGSTETRVLRRILLPELFLEDSHQNKILGLCELTMKT